MEVTVQTRFGASPCFPLRTPTSRPSILPQRNGTCHSYVFSHVFLDAPIHHTSDVQRPEAIPKGKAKGAKMSPYRSALLQTFEHLGAFLAVGGGEQPGEGGGKPSIGVGPDMPITADLAELLEALEEFR